MDSLKSSFYWWHHHDAYKPAFFCGILAIIWAYICFFSMEELSVPVGNYWWDYFALKGLEAQIFDAKADIDNLWMPFLLPIVLLKIAGSFADFGPDYFVAHGLIAAATFLMSYKAVYSNLRMPYAAVAYGVLMVFSLWPVVLDSQTYYSFKDANAVMYHGFYNRYLDIVFCLLVLSFVNFRKEDAIFVFSFWFYALVVALLSKLSYFLVFGVLIWLFCVTERRLSGLAVLALGALVMGVTGLLLPNYFTTVFEIAKVRGLVADDVKIWIAGLLLFLVSFFLYFMPERVRRSLFIPVPLIAAYVVGKGNYGDLCDLRFVFAFIFCVFCGSQLWNVDGFSVGVRFTNARTEYQFSVFSLSVLAVVVMMAKPLAIITKTAVVTSLAMAAHELKLGGSFIEYKHFPGFFSHGLFVEKRHRGAIESGNITLSLFGEKRLHSAGFFSLYARSLDMALAYVSRFDDKKIAWFSFPGLVPQVLGIGEIPPGARPWYLFRHEISLEYHPNFADINDNSDVAVIDQCNWGRGTELRKYFHDQIYRKDKLVFANGCFDIYVDSGNEIAWAKNESEVR